jgi:hypothetical protein
MLTSNQAQRLRGHAKCARETTQVRCRIRRQTNQDHVPRTPLVPCEAPDQSPADEHLDTVLAVHDTTSLREPPYRALRAVVEVREHRRRRHDRTVSTVVLAPNSLLRVASRANSCFSPRRARDQGGWCHLAPAADGPCPWVTRQSRLSGSRPVENCIWRPHHRERTTLPFSQTRL